MNNLIVFVLVCVSLVDGLGLNEEFTWTRIDYLWGRGEEVSSRGRFKNGENRGSQGSNRKQGTGKDKIIFDGSTNGEAEGSNGNNNGNGAPSSIDYQHENNIPMGANVWRNKLFITVPRRRLGVPSTLNYVPLDSRNRHNVPLIPYPSWNINLFPDGNNAGEQIFSVYRVAVDSCDRLWFVDTGTLELPGNITHVKPSELIIIDLQTDQIIQRFTFPSDQILPNTNIASLTIDVTKQRCQDAYAYFPDVAGYGLIVYSLRENRSWRVTHNYFYLESNAGEFFISGHNFQWNDGVFSVELTDVKSDGFRDMYFHSMAGTHQYKVSTRVLRNETLATRSYHGDDFQIVGDRGEGTQTSSADLHQNSNVLFLGFVNQNALACWNINRKIKDYSIVQRDDQKMIYPCDVKVYDDKVYVLTNGMPEFLYGRLNYDQVNFRVWSNNISDAIKGTKCEGRSRSGY